MAVFARAELFEEHFGAFRPTSMQCQVNHAEKLTFVRQREPFRSKRLRGRFCVQPSAAAQLDGIFSQQRDELLWFGHGVPDATQPRLPSEECDSPEFGNDA